MKLLGQLFLFIFCAENVLSRESCRDPKVQDALAIMDDALSMKDHGLSLDWQNAFYLPLFRLTYQQLETEPLECLLEREEDVNQISQRLDEMISYHPEINNSFNSLVREYEDSKLNPFIAEGYGVDEEFIKFIESFEKKDDDDDDTRRNRLLENLLDDDDDEEDGSEDKAKKVSSDEKIEQYNDDLNSLENLEMLLDNSRLEEYLLDDNSEAFERFLNRIG